MENRISSVSYSLSLFNRKFKENSENILFEIYDLFTPEQLCEKFEAVNSLEEYAKFTKQLTQLVNDLISHYLYTYPKVVKKAVLKGSLMGFNGTKEEREQFLYLNYQKNRLYYDILLAFIEKGGLDNILPEKDKQDVINILRSRYIELFDEIFISWLVQGQNNTQHIPEGLHYGGVKDDGKIHFYGEFRGKTFDQLGYMFNYKLKEYLLGIKKLSLYSFDKKNWEKNQELEPQIWKDKTSKLGFVGPQEAYMLENSNNGGKLVEPHIALYIKESFEKERQQAKKLYDKYFGENYNVENLSTFLVEPIFEAGSQGFRKIAGESIPNSDVVAQKYGRINLVIPSRLRARMEDEREKLNYLLGGKLDNNLFEEIVKYSDEFVKFHELGHSLFKNTNYDSNLEELKADLSYFLKIYDDLKNGKNINIEAFVGQFIIDIIRIFKNINPKTKQINSQMYQYIISAIVELKEAFDSGFLGFDNRRLFINPNKFNNFIIRLKDILFEIKNIYETKNKKVEEEFIKAYNMEELEVWKFIEFANM